MKKSLLAPLQRSIKAKLILGTAAIVLGVVCTLSFVMARNAANLLHRESLNQLAQVLNQSVGLLSGFLEVRDANLDVWVSNPLPKAVVSDPALGSVFVPSLRDYFAKFKAKEPWIENIYLLKDDAAVYDDAEAFTLMEKGDGSPGGVQRLLGLAPSGLTVMNLQILNPAQDTHVIAMKRPLLEEGAPIESGFLLLLLNLETIQQKLFGQITIGKNGFLSVVARLSKGGAETIWRRISAASSTIWKTTIALWRSAWPSAPPNWPPPTPPAVCSTTSSKPKISAWGLSWTSPAACNRRSCPPPWNCRASRSSTSPALWSPPPRSAAITTMSCATTVASSSASATSPATAWKAAC